MAARRGKNQARRSGQARRSSLLWLAVGLGIGGLVFGYLHFKDQRPLDSLLPTPDPNAKARTPSSEDAVADAADKPKPKKYDFYDILPGKEVVIPDAELAAAAQEEAARAAHAGAAADHAPDTVADAPPSETLSLDSDAPASNAATPGAPAAATVTPTATDTASTGAKYLIQAGAFLGSNEAEALKAQIAMTGQVARVEVAEINGKTVHRVRMGPYPNAGALAAAKAALASHGIDAQAIRVK